MDEGVIGVHTCAAHVLIAVYAVTDPQLPRGKGEGANTLGGGAGGERCQHIILPNFPKDCMRLKEFGPERGGCGGACKISLCRSGTGMLAS